MSLIEQPHTRRFTREEYHAMADLGMFEDQRVELIEGEVVEMPAQRNEHAKAIRKTDYALRRVFQEGYTLSIQSPLRVNDRSEPEPDIAVLRGDPQEIDEHPTTALLVVEVSDTTLLFDRQKKPSLYAEAGVPEYWIVNLVDLRLEVRRTPRCDTNGIWGYADTRLFHVGDVVSPVSAAHASVSVADLLP